MKTEKANNLKIDINHTAFKGLISKVQPVKKIRRPKTSKYSDAVKLQAYWLYYHSGNQ